MLSRFFLQTNKYSRIDKCPISLRFRVSSLIELSELDKAAQLSRLAVFDKYCGLNSENIVIRNEIIGALCAAKKYDDAIELYYFFRSKSKIANSAISFNHIIKAHCDENRVDEALMLSNPNRNCVVKDVSVDTLRLLTKALVNKGRIYEAMGLIKYTRISDSVVYSYLIRGFLDLGEHDMAYDLSDEFNHMSGDPKGRAVVDATFVDYWLKQGEEERAMEIYKSLVSREVCASTGNTLLEILFDNGKETEAWDLFNAMLTNSLTYNRDTFGTVVTACFKLRHFKQALHTFNRPEFTRRSSRCYANIIALFCDHGMMSQAQDLFDEIPQYLSPHVPTFRSLINGYAKAGRVDDALRILKLMVDATLLKFALHSAN